MGTVLVWYSPWNPNKASRLKSQNDAVFIILLGLLCFRRSPPIRANHQTSESTNQNHFWAVGLFSAHILQTIPSVTCLFHVITQFLFCFVGPFLLTSVFIKHKNNLYGIWDEAEMNLNHWLPISSIGISSSGYHKPVLHFLLTSSVNICVST